MYSIDATSVGYAWNKIRSVKLRITAVLVLYEGVLRVAPASFISWS